MNRHFLKIFITLVGICLFAVFALGSGSGESSDVSTGSNDPKSSSSEKAVQPLKIAVDYEESFSGLSVKIAEIQIEEDGILVGMTISNNSASMLSIYPDQGNVVIGNMQLDANMFSSEGDASGDIQPGVQKSAVIRFDVPQGNALTPNEVKEVQLHFGDVFNSDDFESTKCDITISIE